MRMVARPFVGWHACMGCDVRAVLLQLPCSSDGGMACIQALGLGRHRVRQQLFWTGARHDRPCQAHSTTS